MLSYWEQKHFLDYDYIIVGAGLVGLSTALELRKREPTASIVVLERGIFPSGASTKNAGFACFGSLTELIDDLEILSQDEMLALVEMRWKGLLKLRKRLGDDGIGLVPDGGYELLQPEWNHAVDRMEEINKLLYPIFDQSVFSIAEDSTFGFNKSAYTHLIKNPLEASIDTGKMMRNLLAHVQQQEITVLTGVTIEQVEENGEVITNSGIHFRGKQVCLATNAFSKQFIPEADLAPGRGIVLITKPVDGLPFKGVFHMDAGYFYFRNVGNRILFGGGRNLYKAEEETTDFAINDKIMNALHQRLRDVIIPETDYEVEMQWAGIMAFGTVKKPIVERLGPKLCCAVRMGGMGVAMGRQVGEMAARLILQD